LTRARRIGLRVASAGLALSAAGCAKDRQAASAPYAARCAVARSIVGHMIDKAPAGSFVVDSRPDTVFPYPTGGAGWRDDQGAPLADPPPDALIAMLEAQRNVSMLSACPEVVALLESGGMAHGHDAALAVQSRPAKDGPRRTVLALSLPAVAADGRSAIFEESSIAGPLAGHGQLTLVRKDAAGRWTRAGVTMLWVS
jgi:hypothetical protein